MTDVAQSRMAAVKITNNPQRIAPSDIHGTRKAAEPAQKAAAPASSAQYQASSARDTSQDIDMARVDEIRTAISEGRLEIRADQIAGAIIASARDLSGQ